LIAASQSYQFPSISQASSKALARGLEVAEERLFAIARGLSGDYEYRESDFIALFRRYETLSEADKVEIDSLLDAVSREIERRSFQTEGQRLEGMTETSRPVALIRRETLGASAV
jgi:hypothetical protein